MKILFVNGSPNKNGNTAKIAGALLKKQKFETLNLVDYLFTIKKAVAVVTMPLVAFLVGIG